MPIINPITKKECGVLDPITGEISPFIVEFEISKFLENKILEIETRINAIEGNTVNPVLVEKEVVLTTMGET